MTHPRSKPKLTVSGIPTVERRDFLALLFAFAACGGRVREPTVRPPDNREPGFPGLAANPDTIEPIVLDNAEWAKRLDGETYRILRNQGTEASFCGMFWDNHLDGVYICAGCGLALFDSKDKFDSGTGWPSFTGASKQAHVIELSDTSHGMTRTEIRCARCDGHLGHVFDDGPAPSGKRYCLNSAAMIFRSREQLTK